VIHNSNALNASVGAGSVAGCDGEEEETAWKMRVVLFLDAVCPDVNEVEQWPVL